MNLLRNPSFESLDWTNRPAGNTQNQVPEGWRIPWKAKGAQLESAGAFGDVDHPPQVATVTVLPEITHVGYVPKGGDRDARYWNIPEHEQPGKPQALFEDGLLALKLFAGSGAFSAPVEQEVDAPAGRYRASVLVNIHHYYDPSPGAAVIRLEAGDWASDWLTLEHGFRDRERFGISGEFEHDGGPLLFRVVCEGRTEGSANFFLDDARLEPVDAPAEQYDRFVIVADPNLIGRDRIALLYIDAGERLRTITPSHQDANPVPLPPEVRTNTIEIPGVTNDNVDAYTDYHLARNPDTILVFPDLGTPGDDEPPPPPPADDLEWWCPRGTVLGLHGQGDTGQSEIARYAAANDAPLNTAKLVADVGAASLIAKRQPGCLIVGRIIDLPGIGKVEGFHADRDPIEQAERRFRSLRTTVEAHPDVRYWEIVNEEKPATQAGMVAFARFHIRLMELFESIGRRILCFSWGTGSPPILRGDDPWDTYAAMAPTGIFERMMDTPDSMPHGVAVHAYGLVEKDGHDHHFRHEHLYDNYILTAARAMGVTRVPPLFVTEYGVERHDLDKGVEFLWTEAVAYDRGMRKPYVGGIHLYVPQADEDYYDGYIRLWQRFRDYVVSEGDVVNGEGPEPPAPEPEPEPDLEIIDVRDQLATNPASPWYPWRQRTLDEVDTVFVHHSAGTASSDLATVEAIARYHTSPDGKNRPGICYTYVIGADGTIWQTSDIKDVVFSQGSADHPGDENRWGMGVCLLGNFTGGREPTPAQMTSLTALISYIEEVVGKGLRVWGHQDVIGTQCPGDSWPWLPGWGKEQPPPPPTVPLLGFNDPNAEGAAAWMRAEGAGDLLVVPAFLGGHATRFDFSREAEAGIRVIVNLRYSWSTDLGGAGTLPPLSANDRFVAAAIETIKSSAGVWGWEIGNEANNPREWPRGERLYPSDVTAVYNDIYDQVSSRVAPGALDPFNAEAGDPRDWLEYTYSTISGAEFVTAHGYVRGPDPALVGSEARFADDPLRWQYLNYPGCVTELLKALPVAYQGHEVYVTEFNHLWKTVEGDWGWVDDVRAGEIVDVAHYAAAGAGLAGLAIYRWQGDEWQVRDNYHVLEAVKALT
jgi:hypothetical protein